MSLLFFFNPMGLKGLLLVYPSHKWLKTSESVLIVESLMGKGIFDGSSRMSL